MPKLEKALKNPLLLCMHSDMKTLIKRFVHSRYELMPEFDAPILEYIETGEESCGMKICREIEIGKGPPNWTDYLIDTGQLYLDFLGWGKRPSYVRPEFWEFCEVCISIGLKLVDNPRYVWKYAGTPKETSKPWLGKSFLGIRAVGRMDRLDWPEKGTKATVVFTQEDWLENLEYRAFDNKSQKFKDVLAEAKNNKDKPLATKSNQTHI